MAVDIAEDSRDQVQQVVGQGRQETGIGDGTECAGVLREVDVRGRAIALFEQDRRQLSGIGVLDLDLDAGGLGEGLDDRTHE